MTGARPVRRAVGYRSIRPEYTAKQRNGTALLATHMLVHASSLRAAARLDGGAAGFELGGAHGAVGGR